MASFETSASRVIPGQTATIPGTFSIAGNQLHWKPNDPSAGQSFSVAVHAVKGSLQRAKSKPQMRIATISGPLMLEFPGMEERDRAINQMQPLLNRVATRSTEPSGPQADIKNQMLAEDSDLREVYNALVKEGVISDEEFWRARQDLVNRKAGGSGDQQVVGLSSALLAQLQPGADGKSKQMTMTITPQFIQQVFAEKPHVHRAYLENVPQKMNDKEFWTRFARHEIQMQNRHRNPSSRSHEPPDPLFSRLLPTEAAVLDEQRIDPTVNLSVDSYDRRPGAGNDADLPQGHGKSIAQDMNRHSAVVLQGPGALKDPERSEPPASTGAPAEAQPGVEGGAARRGPGGSLLDDLRPATGPATEELQIQNPRRYFERSSQHTNGTAEAGRSRAPSREEIVSSLRGSAPGVNVMGASEAELVLQELRQECQSNLPAAWGSSLLPSLGSSLQSMLRRNALVCNELLRNFWECLPLRSSASREKRATKLRDVLDQKYTELERLQEAADAGDRAVIGQFLKPVKQAIDAALEAFRVEMQPVQRL